RTENNIIADPETEVVIVNGATGGYASALMALLNPGDGILLFEPFYGYHLNAARLAEIEPHFINFTNADLKIDEAAIRAAIRPNSKAIVICSPNNPSGKMWTESELKIIGKIAKEKDLLVFTDEMYEYFRFDGREHISPASLPELKDRTVTIMGLSKTFSITGWRLGYVAAPAALAAKIRLANDLFYVCAPTPLQYGAEAGFDMDKSYYKELREEFQERRDRMCDALDKAGLPPIVPQGAYYVLADISRAGLNDSKLFAMNMLESVGVAGVPGRSFFNSEAGNNYIRFHFAVEDSVLQEACNRISRFKI
ncbi:MAG: pyridoxal phosphate-dependent aminotransferase, partial [Bdellovibrionota bacterium]